MTCKHERFIEYAVSNAETGEARWYKKWCADCGLDMIGTVETPYYELFAVLFGVLTLLCAYIESAFGVAFGLTALLYLAWSGRRYRAARTDGPTKTTVKVTESGAWIDDLIDDLERCGPRSHTAPRSE